MTLLIILASISVKSLPSDLISSSPFPPKNKSIRVKTRRVSSTRIALPRKGVIRKRFIDEGTGNVFKNSTEGPRLVQESAHKNIGPEDYLTPPSGDDPHASLAEITIDDPGFAEHGDRFEKAWAAQDVDAIAATFAENAVRIVGTAPEAIRGRAAIRDSFSAAFAEGSQFQGSTLSAIILGYRVLDEQHFIANGVWKILDQSGTILARGQWGNLYHRDDNGQVSFLMESAGAMVFDQE